MPEIELYSKTQLDLQFLGRQFDLKELRELRLVTPFNDSQDADMRVIPGTRRDLMALPAESLDGKVDEPWFIDLRIDSDDGAVYIGTGLFHHFANLVGYCPADELRTAYAKIEELEAQIARLTRRNHILRELRAELADPEAESPSGVQTSSGRPRKPAATPAS